MIFNLLCGIIPDIIYFTLFIIFAKNIKTKIVPLFLLMSVTYTLDRLIFGTNICTNIIFTFVLYLIMKFLYRKEANIMDIFLLTWASVFYIIVTLITYVIFKELYLVLIFSRILMFILIIIFRKTLSKLYNKCIVLWNRHEYKKQLKSVTVRNINIVLLNVSVYVMYSLTLILSK